MDILDNAPGPSPWCFRPDRPPFPGFRWTETPRASGVAGVTVLHDARGPLVLLDFHHYAVPLAPGTLLIWHQPHVERGPTAPVVVIALRLADLQPLSGDPVALSASMRMSGKHHLLHGAPLFEFTIPTTVSAERRNLDFPDGLMGTDELLILCRSSGIDSDPSWERSNLALLVASPRSGDYELYPQDWYNGGGFDYGYQWVSHVARNPTTGRVHGKGVRIESFVLDETLRHKATHGRAAV